ncbi:MAG: leucine--tRNA ligase [Verrucomicrobiota bacterium]|nr:leucine--tRNA ligase [Verrucomicrobiota bacterium]
MKKYEPRLIEAKWQKIWKEKNLFAASILPGKPKYYILDMFPYPSGAGLHVGHVTGYTGTDILARYKRQKGFNVLHPMGWDSFGLPAEQFALRTGTHPAVTTQNNITTYRRQLEALGFSYDWKREIATSDPSYYRWTQWLFTKLFERGLAYEADVLVNFCPALGTVLANEEVENGRAKEGGYPVERRPLKQWILKITAYADRLLADLDLLDWPEHVKKLQVNWIGKSSGVLVDFVETATQEKISLFTTAIHTLFGVTFLVLSPEHPLVKRCTTKERLREVEAFLARVASRSDLERSDPTKEKEGVWTGAFALHPVTGEKIPVWVADYVLMGYGTGAVMGVPAHDERDHLFAERYRLPEHQVIEEGVVRGSSHPQLSLDGLTVEEAKVKATRWLEETGKGRACVQYKLRDWLFSRQRYWGEPIPILHFADGSMRALSPDELPLTPPHLDDFHPAGDGRSALAKVSSWVEVTDPKTGKRALRETNTMPQWAGSCWYYLRFCDPHNGAEAWSQEAERYWMPVDLYVGGIEHAVLHLLYARFWHKVFYDLGLVHTSEPFLRLCNQGLVTAASYKKEQGGYLPPEEVVEKEGKFFSQATGEEVQQQMEKMSKSKLNGVSPDAIIEEFGADALRIYEMFMGPFEKEKVWSTEAVEGPRRFLQRFHDLVFSSRRVEEESLEAMRLAHRLVDRVSFEIEALQFNTAIAKMMEFLNAFSPLSSYPKRALSMAVQMLYPFAPHLAEELWEELGEKELLAYAPIPSVDPAFLRDATLTYVIQVNGKLRARLDLPADLSEEELMAQAFAQSDLQKHVTGTIVKRIFVPNKLLNIVISPN